MNAYVHGRVALVTGASSGIGAACARLLAELGYTVYGASRRGTLPEATPRQGGALMGLIMDVTDESSVHDGIARIYREAGRLDILIHAAGDGYYGPIECSTAEDVYKQLNVSYFGALRLLNEVLPSMRARQKGLVLLVGSVGGEFAIPFQTPYSCTKAALAMLSDGLRMELASFHVQACLVAPGDVKTGFTGARKPITLPCPQAYEGAMRHAISRMEQDEQSGMPPEAVARAVAKVLAHKRVKAHVVVGRMYALFIFLKRLLPYAWVEKALSHMY